MSDLGRLYKLPSLVGRFKVDVFQTFIRYNHKPLFSVLLTDTENPPSTHYYSFPVHPADTTRP